MSTIGRKRKRFALVDAKSRTNSPCEWWRFFKRFAVSEGQGDAVACMLCYEIEAKRAVEEDRDEQFSAFGKYIGRSTTEMENHLRSAHAKEYGLFIDSKASAKMKKGATMLDFVKYKSDTELHFLRWMVRTYQPFSTFDDEDLRKACQGNLPSKERMKTLLKNQASVGRAFMQTVIGNEFYAITLDKWTSVSQESYLGVTAHFITSTWKLEKLCISCRVFSQKGATAEDIVSEFKDVVLHRSVPLDISNCVTVVSDTEATMNKFGKLIKTDPRLELSWVGCVCHLFELVSGVLLSSSGNETVDSTMKAARRLVNHFRHSNQDMSKLKDVQPKSSVKMLVEDVSTRWWSTYAMIETLLELKPYIDLCNNNNTIDENLSDPQWFTLKAIREILSPFHVAQEILESEKKVTLSIVPVIVGSIRIGLNKAIEDKGLCRDVKAIALAMMKKFEEQWGSGINVLNDHKTEGPRGRQKGLQPCHFIANYLDPRFRNLVAFRPEEREEIKRFVVDALSKDQQLIAKVTGGNKVDSDETHEVDEEESDSHEPYADTQDESPVKMRVKDGPISTIEEDDDYAPIERVKDPLANCLRILEQENGTIHREQPSLELVANEIKLYDKETPVTTDPLTYWRDRGEKYRFLSLAARKYLCIPASSAPVERLFSSAGQELCDKRSRLHSTYVNDTVFLHESWDTLTAYEKNQKIIQD